MRASRELRVRITEAILGGSPPAAEDAVGLRRILERLESIPRTSSGRCLRYDGKSLSVDLSYEITELRKDLVYLNGGEGALLHHLAGIHRELSAELEAGRRFLAAAPPRFRSFVTDRDGTVNNYCGRYYSSIQSVYNAVFLTRFARQRCRRGVILTSAPLEKGGLVEVGVIPQGVFVLAGSKGREALDEEGGRHRLPIPAAQQAALDRLNQELARLLERPEFEIFGLIGSGLQLKFGQSTVAHQDVRGSIPEALSRRFRGSVEDLLRDLDPERRTFRTEDTGKDLEILLTVDADGAADPDARGGADGRRDFDKGDGVRFLDRELGLGLERGPTLVCGDTSSDLPMVRAAIEAGGETWSIFVTRDTALGDALRGVAPRSWIASEPDVLVALLGELGKETQ